MFGVLEYKNSFNLGDNIQSLAACQFLPQIDALIDRDTSSITCLTQGSFHLICNAWTDGLFMAFPFPPQVRPLFVSLHINESNDSKSASFKHMHKNALPFVSLASHVDYFKRFEPIGCRDIHTHLKLCANGIKSFFSGCLTLTLNAVHIQDTNDRNDDILIVDVNPDQMFRIPPTILKRAIFLTHLLKKQLPHSQKMELACNLLKKYRKARLVITSRLHVAMPCLAFETPVFFLHGRLHEDVRFKGLIDLLDTSGSNLPLGLVNNYDPLTILGRPNPNVTDIILELVQKVQQWVQRVIASRQGISIITACMNRQLHLKEVLPTWIQCNPVEIIIVDWGTTTQPSISSVIATQQDTSTEIILISVENVDMWCLTQAFNLASKFVSCDKILKLDCDSILKPYFFNYHSLIGDVFFAGNWKIAKDKNERHTNGIVFVKKNDFFQCFYNELITKYGYDDDDLYLRLVDICKLKRLDLNLSQIEHLPHEAHLRTSLQDCSNSLEIQIECNRLISMETKNIKVPLSVFQWKHHNIFTLTAKMTLHKSIEQKHQLQAIYNRFHGRKLFIEPQNGIGNRLRVLASAYNISKMSERRLVVIWPKDKHCDANISDLFDLSIEPFSEMSFLDFTPPLDALIQCQMSEHQANDLLDYTCYNDKGRGEGEEGGEEEGEGEEGEGEEKEGKGGKGGEEELQIYNYNLIKDEYINDTIKKNIYIKSACVLKSKHTSYQKESIFLQKMQPKASLIREIDCFLKENNDFKNVVSVHVRSGQHGTPHDDISYYNPLIKASLEKWRCASKPEMFVVEMKKIINEHPLTRFFVCCDTAEGHEFFSQQFKPNIVFSYPCKLYDRSKRQIQLALIDAILLSKTKLILGSNWSSFTEIAHRLGYPYQKIKYAGKDFGL